MIATLGALLFRVMERANQEMVAQHNALVADAKAAMVGKTVNHACDDAKAAVVVGTMIDCGAKYALRQDADYVVDVGNVKRIGFADIYIYNNHGKLLHTLSVSESAIVRDEALEWMASLVQPQLK